MPGIMKFRGSDQPAPEGGANVLISMWVFDQREWTSTCMCCGCVIATVFPMDDEHCHRLLEHQLNCEGIPRDLALDVTNSARANGLPA